MNDKRLFLGLLLVFSCFLSAQNLKVMSYNLRVDFGGDGANNWEFRRDMLAGQLALYNPDFIGTQEGKAHQLHYLDAALPNHQYVGLSRDNSKTEGEFSAIFYNAQKFKVLQEKTFWLSPTPQIKSKGWDAAYERICTYVLFEDLKTRKKFWFFNTHLDHIGAQAREQGVALILAEVQKVNPQKLPVIFTGDFNSTPDSATYQMVIQQFQDARTATVAAAFGPSGTFNGFKCNEPVLQLIDYIFVAGVKQVCQYAVLSDSKDCRYPSDHFPVYAEMELPD